MQHNLFNESTPLPPSTDNAKNDNHDQYTRSSPSLYPPSHHNAPEGTSEVAAARIATFSPNQRERVFEAILSAGARGLTDEEGETITGIKTQSYTPRRGELVSGRLIRDTGERRKTQSGCTAAVWVAVSKREGSSND
tara:strand:- start:160 stop:570 length:411 start_codon:yes stop_codon:yes gene_type:complete